MLNYKNARREKIGKQGRTKVKVTATCMCGLEFSVSLEHLTSGHTKSCGCLKGEAHKETKIRLYLCWQDMKKRCLNKKNKSFPYYGERGIKVCENWKNSYLTFKKWAIENGYKSTLTLDRISVNKNYSPENCRWATRNQQSKNKRNNIKYKGECASEASERLEGGRNLVSGRVLNGWSKERAFNTPLRKKKIC